MADYDLIHWLYDKAWLNTFLNSNSDQTFLNIVNWTIAIVVKPNE